MPQTDRTERTTVLACGHTVTIAEYGGEGMCACIELLAARHDVEGCDDPQCMACNGLPTPQGDSNA